MLEIARITIYEYRRNKTFLLFCLVGLVAIRGGAYIVSNLVIQDNITVLGDFIIMMMELMLLMVMTFLAASSFYHDMQRKTFILLHTKAVPATSYVLGKFLGFASMVVMLFLIFFLSYIAYASFTGIESTYIVYMGYALLSSMCKILVMVSGVLLASSLFSPVFSFCMSLGVYWIAHMYGFVLFSLQQNVDGGSILYSIFAVLFYLFPRFDILTLDAHKYTPSDLGISLVFHVIYIAVLLCLAIYVFQRKKRFSLHTHR